jgi:hypothetical protein
VGDTGLILRDQIVEDLNKDTFCPQNPVFNQTKIGKDITTAADSAVKMLNDLGNFINGSVIDLQESLDDGRKKLNDVDGVIADAEQIEWIGKSNFQAMFSPRADTSMYTHAELCFIVLLSYRRADCLSIPRSGKFDDGRCRRGASAYNDRLLCMFPDLGRSTALHSCNGGIVFNVLFHVGYCVNECRFLWRRIEVPGPSCCGYSVSIGVLSR